jgi:serine protease Do
MERRMSETPNLSRTTPARTLRAALLGAVAMAGVGGLAYQAYSPALAQVPALTVPASAAAPVSFAPIVERVRGAVISVKVKTIEAADNEDEQAGSGGPGDRGVPQMRPGDPLERFFRRFGGETPPFGRQQPQHPRSGQSLGSGFIISEDGYAVTNNHVVENATDVSITLDDGRTVAAEVVGADKRTDLALLKIKDKGPYPHVSFATDMPRVGDWVIAVGNPFGLGGTVTAGIVSARGRDIGAGPYDDFLQIDASVNRGNSGGPTFNLNGDVVGVNTAIFSPSGGSVGIGFAIPTEVARDVIDALRNKGSVARGWIGVQIQPVTREIADSLAAKDARGALVSELQPASPAGTAGIKSGDIITAVNGERIDAPRDLARKIAAFGPDKQVDLTYLRDGREQQAKVRLSALPADTQQRASLSGNAPSERNALAGLGLTLAPSREGVVVAEVEADGVAAQMGLKQGDVILEAGGQKVERPGDVLAALASAKKDGRRALLMRVKSGNTTRFVALAAVG